LISAFLYDAKGDDCAVGLDDAALPELSDDRLLWLEVTGREDEAELRRLAGLLSLDEHTRRDLTAPFRAHFLANHGAYFHAAVAALGNREDRPGASVKPPKKVRLDLVVGKNWLATIADEKLAFLEAFREQDRGETMIGALSSAALAASILDWHLSRYFEALERLEADVDLLEMRILSGRRIGDSILAEVFAGRRFVAILRRNLGPQRSVFYGLSRPDFSLVADAEAGEHFKALALRFERAIDSIEHARTLVQGSFDLFATRVAESTNTLIRRLTFFSIALGAVGAVAGIFGMNFQTPYTQSGLRGFWMVIGALGIIVVVSAVVSRLRKWI
jgi:Mg2+ and Co2+ transporter CorA